jgi:hypothetical protein
MHRAVLKLPFHLRLYIPICHSFLFLCLKSGSVARPAHDTHLDMINQGVPVINKATHHTDLQ